ncbi:hypothetical protein HDU98_001400, partial [Podochytrium sp. JEL0797]
MFIGEDGYGHRLAQGLSAIRGHLEENGDFVPVEDDYYAPYVVGAITQEVQYTVSPAYLAERGWETTEGFEKNGFRYASGRWAQYCASCNAVNAHCFSSAFAFCNGSHDEAIHFVHRTTGACATGLRNPANGQVANPVCKKCLPLGGPAPARHAPPPPAQPAPLPPRQPTRSRAFGKAAMQAPPSSSAAAPAANQKKRTAKPTNNYHTCDADCDHSDEDTPQPPQKRVAKPAFAAPPKPPPPTIPKRGPLEPHERLLVAPVTLEGFVEWGMEFPSYFTKNNPFLGLPAFLDAQKQLDAGLVMKSWIKLVKDE